MAQKNRLTKDERVSYLHSVATPLQQAAHVSPNAISKSKTINIALWISQVLWGGFFCFTGFGKIMCYRPTCGPTRSINLWRGSPLCRKACSSSSVSVSFLEAPA